MVGVEWAEDDGACCAAEEDGEHDGGYCCSGGAFLTVQDTGGISLPCGGVMAACFADERKGVGDDGSSNVVFVTGILSIVVVVAQCSKAIGCSRFRGIGSLGVGFFVTTSTCSTTPPPWTTLVPCGCSGPPFEEESSFVGVVDLSAGAGADFRARPPDCVRPIGPSGLTPLFVVLAPALLLLPLLGALGFVGPLTTSPLLKVVSPFIMTDTVRASVAICRSWCDCFCSGLGGGSFAQVIFFSTTPPSIWAVEMTSRPSCSRCRNSRNAAAS